MPCCDDDADCANECERGERGRRGKRGYTGSQGPCGFQGFQGFQGQEGKNGSQGVLGFQGAPISGLASADFFAWMPEDNASPIAVGADVDFPRDGENSLTGINRTSPNSFALSNVGLYLVLFNVPVTEAGQLVLALDATELLSTVSGRTTGMTQICGNSLVRTTVPNSVLTLRNPNGNPIALTLTPFAGGSFPVSAHLTIVQVM